MAQRLSPIRRFIAFLFSAGVLGFGLYLLWGALGCLAGLAKCTPRGTYILGACAGGMIVTGAYSLVDEFVKPLWRDRPPNKPYG